MSWSRRRPAARTRGVHRSRLLTFAIGMLEPTPLGASISLSALRTGATDSSRTLLSLQQLPSESLKAERLTIRLAACYFVLSRTHRTKVPLWATRRNLSDRQ